MRLAALGSTLPHQHIQMVEHAASERETHAKANPMLPATPTSTDFASSSQLWSSPVSPTTSLANTSVTTLPSLFEDDKTDTASPRPHRNIEEQSRWNNLSPTRPHFLPRRAQDQSGHAADLPLSPPSSSLESMFPHHDYGLPRNRFSAYGPCPFLCDDL